MGDVVSTESSVRSDLAENVLESRGDWEVSRATGELNEKLPDGENDPQRKAEAEAQKKENERPIEETRIQTSENVIKSNINQEKEFGEPITSDISSMSPEGQEKLNNVGQDAAGVVEEIQAKNGEDGLPLEESPKTLNELKDKFMQLITKNEGKILAVFNILAALSGVVGISITSSANAKAKKWNKDNPPKLPVGCLRVNLATGEISWPPKDRQCGISGSTSGVCDKDAGKSSFCDIMQYPMVPCQITYTNCADKSAGGGCDLGDGEKDGEFTYIPVCGDMNLLYSSMVMLSENKDFFLPKKTPLFLTIISLIFIILLVVTIAWYLYKDVKKILNKNK